MARLVPDTAEVAPASTPSYKVTGDSKLPVSKQYGPLWKSRRDAATRKRQDQKLDTAWSEAIRYYDNDQTGNRNPGDDRPTKGLASKIILEYAEIENFIFVNTNSAVSAIYAKNPAIAITTQNPQLEAMGRLSQELINTLFAKLEAPGVNLKPKAQRAIVSAFLCNLGYIKVGWTNKSDSTEQALTDLGELAQELSNPENTGQQIEIIEGKLRALDDQFAMLSESGPFVKYVPPTAILRDPSSIEEDLSDAYWVMEEDYFPTSYLKARWMSDDSDASVYEPTHYLPTGIGKKDSTASITEEVNNFSIFDASKSYTELGFDNQESYDASKVTKVWWVWDRVTRRVFLYHDKCWTWPVWVWDDPLKLTTFFPYVSVYFYCTPKGGESKGEVSYYLDQQDAINLCNSLAHSVRGWTATKVGFNPNYLSQADVDRYLHSPKLEAIPINTPEGMKLEDALPKGLEHPAARQLQLFDKTQIYQSIDRLSVINEVQRGGQFRTNTTNQAVEYYGKVAQSRFDAIIDRVEDAIGRVGYLLLQLCWRYMEAPAVASLLGLEDAQEWMNLTDQQIRGMSIRVEGGSTQKPNSSGKKQEAIQLGQILGQFAGASPVAVILAIKAMARAFSDSIDIDEDEWQQLVQSMMQQAMAPPAPPEGSPAGPSNPQEAIQAMVAQGVPPDMALAKVKQAMTNGNSNPAPNPQH